MALLLEHRSPALQAIYGKAKDRRALRFEGVESFRRHVGSLRVGGEETREARCREAVMWWVHHLEEEKRQELRQDTCYRALE